MTDGSSADGSQTDRSGGITVGRVLLGLAGLFVFAVALVTSGEPIEVVVATLRAAAGSEYLLAAAIGVATLVLGVAAFLTGREAATQTRMPEPERPVSVPAPGERFDATAGDWRCLLPVFGRERRRAVRRRLRSAAVETLVVSEDCSRETAARRIDRGRWTSDDVAAAFLAESADGSAPTGRLDALVSGRNPTAYRAERTVSAIAALAGVDPEGDG